MTKPHVSTISSSGSPEIQESMSKGWNYIPDLTETVLVSGPTGGSQTGCQARTTVGSLSLEVPRASRQPPPCAPSCCTRPPPHTTRKLDYDLYQNLLGGTFRFYHNPKPE